MRISFSMSRRNGRSSRVAERDRDAVGAGARGAADAVHVALRDVRQVEVDDVADAVDVDAAGGDVGRDQRARRGRRGSRPARARAGSATCCRGSPRRATPALSRPRTTLSAPCLVRVKTSARSIGSLRSTSASSAGLPARSTWMTRCVDALDRGGGRRHRDARPDRCSMRLASSAISRGMVAEKNSVCRLRRQLARRSCGCRG